jgi:hypothetical protein
VESSNETPRPFDGAGVSTFADGELIAPALPADEIMNHYTAYRSTNTG